MALQLTKAQLDHIASTLLIFRPPDTTRLAKPANSTGALSLAAKLDAIGTDARFAHLGIGVVDLTNIAAPRIWLHNAEEKWRIASTAKLALILAAVQLRDDVRRLFSDGIIASASEGDALFDNPDVWRQSTNPLTAEIAKSTRRPRISTVFDFPASGPPEFLGGTMIDPGASIGVFGRLKQDYPQSHGDPHLKWAQANHYKFSERLWMAGALSDNIAATSCISEIGVAYLKAVQVAYGLADIPNGMGMLLADGYKNVDRNATVLAGNSRIKYRSIRDIASTYVADPMLDRATGRFSDHQSSESGNVNALLAYMIAWRQQKFINSDACNIITHCLADKQPFTMGSRIAEGVPHDVLRNQYTKIGLLDKIDGEAAYLNCEFAYVETQPTPGVTLNYGVVVTGIRPGNTGFADTPLGQALGSAIYQALST